MDFEIAPAQLGRHIAQLRDRAQLKQAELARKVTWSPTILSRIEAGERQLSSDELELLIEAIGTPEAKQLLEVIGRTWVHLEKPDLDHPEQELLWTAEQTIVELHRLAEDSSIRPTFARRLQAYAEEITRRASILHRRDHQIAFVGNIGVGKSTAICRVTGLEVANEKADQPQPILETGAGGITLCEVLLRVGPGFGVFVEPRSYDDIRLDVTDFVDQVIRKDAPAPPEDDQDGGGAVPREIERAIRNMAGLGKTKKKLANGKTERRDPAVELAQSKNKSEMIVEVLDRMDLHRRDKRDLWFDQSTAADPKAWLKDTFERINNGRHPDFSLPRRIELIVEGLLSDPRHSIIDTRGIDLPGARADLEGYLDDPHTIVVLCSRFNEAPATSLQHLLERAREVGNKLIDTNVCLLVLPQHDEALAMKDEAGIPADSYAEGYELKQEQVQNALARSPISMPEASVGFFNAYKEPASELAEYLEGRISSARTSFASELGSTLKQAQGVIENADAEQELEEQRVIAGHISSWIDNHSSPSIPDDHVYEPLLREMQQTHASTVRAAVRREGEWFSFSYAHQLGHGARRLAFMSLDSDVTGFKDVCATLAGSTPEAEPLLAQAADLMTTAYDDLLRRAQLAGQTLYADQLQHDAAFWMNLQAEWGQGPGYRDRVTSRNRDWFSPRVDLEKELGQWLQREWSAVLERVKSIFDFS